MSSNPDYQDTPTINLSMNGTWQNTSARSKSMKDSVYLRVDSLSCPFAVRVVADGKNQSFKSSNGGYINAFKIPSPGKYELTNMVGENGHKSCYLSFAPINGGQQNISLKWSPGCCGHYTIPQAYNGPIGSGSQSSGSHHRVSDFLLTSYCSCKLCCGKSDGITASGHRLSNSDHLRVCAAPPEIPFGTRLKISGGWSGEVVVVDRGGSIKSKRLDIYCKSHQEALAFGRKEKCTVEWD